MDFILEIENVLDLSTCKSIIDRFENDDRKKRGETQHGLIPSIKFSTDLSLGDESVIKEWEDVVSLTYSCVLQNISKYINDIVSIHPKEYECINSVFNKCIITPPKIQKTPSGGFYKWHHDGLLNRIVTYIIYLNDVSPEHGGSTDFMFGKSVQPKAGKMVIFPANFAFIHRGREVKNGSKYIITGFICDIPKSDFITA